MSNPVHLSRQGPPETVLDPEPAEFLAAMADALAIDDVDARRDRVGEIVATHPTYLDGWAQIGNLARTPIEAYAAYRVGYHRGLDRLRASGWRGSGYVRWEHESNRGFLRALMGLGRAAAAIDETDEIVRINQFVAQLDPDLHRRLAAGEQVD